MSTHIRGPLGSRLTHADFGTTMHRSKMARRSKGAWLAPLTLCFLGLTTGQVPERELPAPPDLLVVGAGIAGLSSAIEAATRGAQVTVVDMWSIFGGHAVMSQGGLCIVDSPYQRSQGIEDSPALAAKDFLEWGEDAEREWVDYYVRHSREEIYDWLTSLGVEFDSLIRLPGNSVPRFHQPRGRGLGLVTPIYRECVENESIQFEWNLKVTSLLTEAGRVIGVRGEELRTGRSRELRARAVLLATGGFQSNLDMVREFWPQNLPFPETILAGSGLNSMGSGLELAQRAGAELHRMDHQWNYSTGLPDPRYPRALRRGLNASNQASIWVNAQGKRFTNETGSTKETFPVLLAQKPATYWAVFDEGGKRQFSITGSDWGDFRRIQEVIFDNPELVSSAGSLEGLAAAAGLPASALIETVRRYNQLVHRKEDTDFGRFGRNGSTRLRRREEGELPPKIEKPPFYAVQFYPLTRKSMGGVRIDTGGRVLAKSGRTIPRLYAAGEVTGMGGINGKAGLEGTFLGPSLVIGRVAARTVVSELGIKPSSAPPSTESPQDEPSESKEPGDFESCRTCHDLETLVSTRRTGYSHFEKTHRVVLERGYDCGRCHAELEPFDLERHGISRLAQIDNCKFCHLAEEPGH